MPWWNSPDSCQRTVEVPGKQAFLALLLLSLTACDGSRNPPDNDLQAFWEHRTEIIAEMEPCNRDAATANAALVAESYCMEFSRPENPDQPQARQIDLKVMLVPALSDFPESDPLVLFAGGPGQAATTLTDVVNVFGRIRTERDILLVDQRGTGELSPFNCNGDIDEIVQDLSLEEMLVLQEEVLTECLAETQADPIYYSTWYAMQDMDAIREYFNFNQLNLWGASYGTRAALAYLQAYPEHIRTVIIDGVAPVTLRLPLNFERDASASLQSIIDDCNSDDNCRNTFEDLPLMLEELKARFSEPVQVAVTDPEDLSREPLTLSDDMFFSLLRLPLYSREAQRLIPFMIQQAHAGNYQPLITLSTQFAEAQINQGMFLSVVCSEDFSLLDDESIRQAQEADYLLKSRYLSTPIVAACDLWPASKPPEDYFETPDVDRPVLILSGTQDPVTPPVWGDEVHETLPDSLHLVAEGFAHGTMFNGCIAGIMTDFIISGSLAGLETECVEHLGRRPFFLTPGGAFRADD